MPEDRIRGSGETLVQLAQESRPEVQAAAAAAANSRAALSLARADQIPIFSLGPAYERNETGAVFYGVALSSPVPLLNTGRPLVGQREAEYHRDCVAWEQARQQVATQVLAVMVKWNQAQQAAERTHARFEPIRTQTERMQRLYDAGTSRSAQTAPGPAAIHRHPQRRVGRRLADDAGLCRFARRHGRDAAVEPAAKVAGTGRRLKPVSRSHAVVANRLSAKLDVRTAPAVWVSHLFMLIGLLAASNAARLRFARSFDRSSRIALSNDARTMSAGKPRQPAR